MTNSTKSAFFIAKLKPSFFSRYKPLGETNVEKRRGVRCQLYAKVRAAPVVRTICSRLFPWERVAEGLDSGRRLTAVGAGRAGQGDFGGDGRAHRPQDHR